MLNRTTLSMTVLAVICALVFVGAALASGPEYNFPYAKIKKFLLKETRFVTSPDHINGYHDDGNGKVSVYCTRVAHGNEIVGQILYQFLLLQTDSGPRWLYLGNVKSQFID